MDLEDKLLLEYKINQILIGKDLVVEGHINLCKYEEEDDIFNIYRRKIKNYKEFYKSMADKTHVFKVKVLDYSILEILYSEIPELKEQGIHISFVGGNIFKIEDRFTRINYSFEEFKNHHKDFINKLDLVKNWV